MAALAVLWTVFLISALPVSHRWLQNRGVRYVDNLRAGVAAQDRRGPWSMYTTFVPQTVTLTAYGRYSLAPSIAELVADHPVSADDLSKPMFVVDPDGHLRPARFDALASAPDVCSTGPQRIMQPISQPLAKGVWNVQLSYRVEHADHPAVRAGPRHRRSGGGDRLLPWLPGQPVRPADLRAAAVRGHRLPAGRGGGRRLHLRRAARSAGAGRVSDQQESGRRRVALG